MGIKRAKALTIKQPYPWLILTGIKDIENRTWTTDYRGRIYIHSSKQPNIFTHPYNFFTKEQYDLIPYESRKEIINGAWLTNSAILGYVDLVDIVTDSKSVWAIEGQYHWVLENPKLFDEPILDVKGKLSLWDCTGLIRKKLRT